jgi:hypothetical protein
MVAALFVMAVGFPSSLIAGDGEEAVRKTIVDSYVRGIHIDRDVEAVKRGFHPAFTMFYKDRDGGVGTLTIDKWADSIAKKKKEEPDGPAYKVTYEIPMVDISGDAAVARVLIYRDGKLIYSDYMSLYRFEDGWKIVGKIYYSHKG